MLLRPATGPHGWQQRLDQHPLRVGQVRRVAAVAGHRPTIPTPTAVLTSPRRSSDPLPKHPLSVPAAWVESSSGRVRGRGRLQHFADWDRPTGRLRALSVVAALRLTLCRLRRKPPIRIYTRILVWDDNRVGLLSAEGGLPRRYAWRR